MTVATKSQRAVAIALALLTLTPVIPTGVAEHTQDLVPGVPTLPHATATEQCLDVYLSQEILAGVNEALAGDTSRFAITDRGVPAICDASGRPIDQWRFLVVQADLVLDGFRNASADLQRQHEIRLEHTLPGGNKKECHALSATSQLAADSSGVGDGKGAEADPLACDILRPQFTLLDDRFNGRRVGGFGDWQVITARGEDPLIVPASTQTLNGTVHTMRFGDDQGYVRGAHQFLVSPELDLAAVASVQETIDGLSRLRAEARGQVRALCNNPLSTGGGGGFNPLMPFCGDFASPELGLPLGPAAPNPGKLLVQAYERAIDDAFDDLPVTQAGAWLEFTYRINMEANTDGVRVWLYSADRAPTRVDLYGDGLEDGGLGIDCVSETGNAVPGVTDSLACGSSIECQSASGTVTCGSRAHGGVVQMIHGHTAETAAFQNEDVVQRHNQAYALTGDREAFTKVRINLTDHIPQRTWLIFEVATQRDDKGDASFDDFDRRRDFGWELSRVSAYAEGYHRNVRVKDVGSVLEYMPADNEHGDATTVRSVVPPGNDPIDVRIQNAGQYRENATIRVTLDAYRNNGFSPVGTYTTMAWNLTPSEVRVLQVPWSAFTPISETPFEGVEKGRLYRVTARLDVDTGDIPGLNYRGIQLNASHMSDPNNTAVRTINVADLNAPGGPTGLANGLGVAPGNSVVGTTLVRGFTLHKLTPVSGSGAGLIMEVCSAYDFTAAPTSRCTDASAGERGEPRILAVTIRNDGSERENAQAVLTVLRDGISQESIIQGSATQEVNDLLVDEERTLLWTIVPSEPGIYTAKIAFATGDAPDVTHPSVERLVFVQRTTGTICFDDLAAERNCSPSFAFKRPDVLAGENVTALALDAEGVAYLTTAITDHSGALFRVARDGTFTKLANLSNHSLIERFGGTPGYERGFGSIRDITLGNNGSIWMVGLNATILEFTGNGALKWYAPPESRLESLQARVGHFDSENLVRLKGLVGEGIPLAGGATGGREPYAYAWTVVGAVEGAEVNVARSTDARTLFEADTPGSYLLNFTVTDKDGRRSTRQVEVALAAPPTCDVPGALLEEDAFDDGGSAGPASELKCLSLRQDVGVFEMFLGLAGPVRPEDGTLSLQAWFNATTADPRDDGSSKTLADRLVKPPAIPNYVLNVTWNATGVIAKEVVNYTSGPGYQMNTSFSAVPAGDLMTLVIDGEMVPSGKLRDFHVLVRTCDAEANCQVLDDITSTAEWTVMVSDGFDPAQVGGVRAAPANAAGTSIRVTWDSATDRTPTSADAPVDSYIVYRGFARGGPYAEIARVSAPTVTFSDNDIAPNLRNWYVVRAVDPEGRVGPASREASAMPPLPLRELRAAAMIGDTLWTVGTDGDAFFQNGTAFTRADLWSSYDAEEELAVNLTHHLNDVAARGNRAWIVGDHGTLYITNGTTLASGAHNATNISLAWEKQTLNAKIMEAGDMSLKDIHLHGGNVWIVGSLGTIIRDRDGVRFAKVAPPSLASTADFRRAFTTHAGEMFLVDARGAFFTCGTCPSFGLTWAYPQVPVPTVVAADGPRQAIISGIEAGKDITLGVAEGGVIFDFGDRNMYDNANDWLTTPSLVANKGVFQTLYSPGTSAPASQTFRGSVNQSDASTAASADRYRVEVRHHALAATERDPLVIQLIATKYPATQAPAQTCSPYLEPYKTVCGSVIIGQPVVIKKPSITEGWETLVFEVPGYGSGNGLDLPLFEGIEFFKANGSRWIVDRVVVHARNGDTWSEILRFEDGINPTNNRGVWAAHATTATTDPQNQWQFAAEPMALETVSAWHVTHNLADRPVWVANDEIWHHQPGGSTPHLRSNWNTRLLTPAIDLSSAYDPVVSFRHAYAFRTKFYESDKLTTFTVGDAGLVEVQYQLTDKECADVGQAPGCWSRFYPVKPIGGYPSVVDIYGPEGTTYSTNNPSPSDWAAVGPNANAEKPGNSFWGRNVQPSENGIIEDVRFVDSENYEEVRISLADNICREGVTLESCMTTCPKSETPGGCLPINVTGRNIRVAFHLIGRAEVTAGVENEEGLGHFGWNHTAPRQNSDKTPATYAGEGWYIADFKVIGAETLGIDLNATNLDFRVGYDVDRIGVGPGTEVPVNVTIANKGAFAVLGYTGELEIRRVLDAATKRSEVVERITLAQQPVLDPGDWRNHTFLWRVPATEGAEYALRFVATPIGIDADEDITDNTALLGTVAQPILARTHRDFRVEVIVTPENATSEITRFVPIFINNIGNVPLSDIVVKRGISLLRSTAHSEETATWTTSRPIGAGTRVPLSTLSDDVNPAEDLLWKPDERATYRFRVDATAGELTSSSQRLVAAYATYLFDDVDGGVRGESLRTTRWEGIGGETAHWDVDTPGFLTPQAYGFGDVGTKRYPANANASAVSPSIDLSGARSARLAFYHRYELEPRFDGGVIEASADGGLTWHPLTPLRDRLNDLPFGYNHSMPMSPVSAVHETNDPNDLSYAFTGSSCELPAALDCWVFSEFDLTKFPAIREADVVYDIHDSEKLATLGPYDFLKKSDTPPQADHRLADGVYQAADWATDGWFNENLTELEGRSPVGDDTIWWSGSFWSADDGKRPGYNQILSIPVDLQNISRDDPRTVVIDWWEWVERYAKGPLVVACGRELAPDCKRDVREAFSYHNNAEPGHAWRFNVSSPSVVERQGQWFHMQSDVSAWKGEKFELAFVYAPLAGGKYTTGFYNASNPERSAPTNHEGDGKPSDSAAFSSYRQDRGFAVDAFQVVSYQVANGVATNLDVLLNESNAWDASRLEICALWLDDSNVRASLPCYYKDVGARRELPYNDPWGRNERRAIEARSAGTTWAVVDQIPTFKVQWQPIKVFDETGDATTITGEEALAWYSGDTTCAADRDTCLPPGSESRLVTPPFDLSRVAGQTAKLQFGHRFAFPYEHHYLEHSLASGGAVEIQTYNPETQSWSEWTQLFNGPMTPGDTRNIIVPPDSDVRGGYTAYTVNVSSTTFGEFRRHDSPFQPVYDEEHDADFQYLYSGRSTTDGSQEGQGESICASNLGWCNATFDLSNYLGRTVRFGFHVHMNGLNLEAVRLNYESDTSGSKYLLTKPDGETNGLKKGGWWIKDIAVVGDVLKGAPIQVRMRAATDGNVNDGYWQIDDIGLYGSRYANNLGIFYDDTPGKYGMLSGGSVTIPVYIRNLGDTVRRNLALEVEQVGAAGIDLGLGGTAPGGVERLDDTDGRLPALFTGYTLAPGQSARIDVQVAAPAANAADLALLMRLREFNPGSDAYEAITNNEVAGFLSRVVSVHVSEKASLNITGFRTNPPVPVVGEPVDIEITFENRGYGNILAEPACTAQLITGWGKVDHASPDTPEMPRIASSGACTTVETLPTLAAGEIGTVTFRATPTTAGYLRFALKTTVVDIDDNIPNESLPERAFTIPVGVERVTFKESFDNINARDAWGVNGAQPKWSHLRGHRAPGALVLGINESDAGQSGGSNMYATQSNCRDRICLAYSPPVDLHNYTNERIFLSFWHQVRLANYDGADVRVEILMDEGRHQQASAWKGMDITTDECKLYPEGGYGGAVWSYVRLEGDPATITLDDRNPAHMIGAGQSPKFGYFSSMNGWDEEWRLAQFDLSKATCTFDGGKTYVPLLGHVVRFAFRAYLADDKSDCGVDPGTAPAQQQPSDPSPLARCAGHAWVIDDVSVGPVAIDVRPSMQAATLLDNTTKGFNIAIENRGAFADLVQLRYDDGNSSSPDGTVLPPTEPVLLQPGERRFVPVDVKLPRDPSLLPTQYRARVDVQSIFDENGFGRAGLELTFAPRQWAELAINVEAPRVDVQEGAEVFIPITVENTGLVTSQASIVRVIDEYPGARISCVEPVENCYDLPLLPMSSYFVDADDATRTVEFRWRPARGTLGDHTLSFIVDPDVRGEEYTRENNVAHLIVPVVEVLIPDLDIASEESLVLRNAAGGAFSAIADGDVTRYDVTAGELMSLEVKVRNVGRAGATDVDVLASIGPLNLPSKTIPYIAPGGEIVTRFNWIAQKGEYDLSVKVRSEQVEATTVNNDHPSVGVVRLTVKDFEVDVALEAIDAVVNATDTLRVAYTLSNTGNAGEEVILVATADGIGLTLDRTELFLREGESVDGFLEVGVPAHAVAGEHIITVEAVSRENPMKVASGSTTLDVRATYGGAVLPMEARVAPPTFELPVRLLNEGNSLEPWTVNVRLPPGWTAREQLPLKVSVPAYGDLVAKLVIDAPATTPPGTRELSVSVTMPNGETRNGSVLAHVRTMRSAAVTLASDVPRVVDGALAYAVLVENVGNTQAPFEMLLRDMPTGVAVQLKPSLFELPPGGKTAATLLVTPSADVADADIRLEGYTHFDGVQPDTAEGRSNLQSFAISLARPDLRVGRVDIAPRQGIEPGDRVEVKAPIENRGRTTVDQMPLHLYVDDVFVAETRVTLGANERRDVTFNWTALPGEHTLTIVVDPYEEAAEAEREDNAVSTLAAVAGDAVTGVSAGSLIPGPGVLILALAVAFAALLPVGKRRPPK